MHGDTFLILVSDNDKPFLKIVSPGTQTYEGLSNYLQIYE